MSTILVSNNGLEGLQVGDVLHVDTSTITPTAVYETDATQNGTYNTEPAYEGSGYWVFKTSDGFWCKNATKTNNYWDADVVALSLGAYGANQSGSVVCLATTDGTTNYFGDVEFNQSVSSDYGSVNSAVIGPHLMMYGSGAGVANWNTFGDIAASFCVCVNGEAKLALPTEGSNKQAKFDYGLIIGDEGNSTEDSMNYVDMGISGYRGYVEGNCQTLNSIGQANSVCQLMTNNIEAISTSVNADEVIYDNNYVRTSVNHGISSFMFTADDDIYPESANEGDLYYREDRRSLVAHDGENWLVPTEAFPKYSNNDWSAFKLAWGRVAPRYASASFVEPRLTKLSGTWGTYSTANEGVSSAYRWRCSHTLTDGSVFFLPYDENSALVIDQETDTPSYTVNCSGKNKIMGSAYYEGVIYGYSIVTADMVKIDPEANTAVDCPSSLAGNLYGVALYNDLFYLCNSNGSRIFSFDPTDNSVETHNSTVNSFTNTINIALGPDNCLYMLPYRSSEFIVKFDPSDGSFTEITIDLATVNTADKRWDSFLIGSDGCLYIPPTITGAGSLPEICYNPFTGEWSQLGGFTSSTGDAFLTGTAHPSGRLIHAPGNDSDTILVVNTDTKVVTDYDKTASMSAGQKVFQLAGNGNIYGVGRYTNNGLANNTVWKVELGESLPLDYHFVASIYMDI